MVLLTEMCIVVVLLCKNSPVKLAMYTLHQTGCQTEMFHISCVHCVADVPACTTVLDVNIGYLSIRGSTIPEIMMRYVSRYLSHDTIRITILC